MTLTKSIEKIVTAPGTTKCVRVGRDLWDRLLREVKCGHTYWFDAFDWEFFSRHKGCKVRFYGMDYHIEPSNAIGDNIVFVEGEVPCDG